MKEISKMKIDVLLRRLGLPDSDENEQIVARWYLYDWPEEKHTQTDLHIIDVIKEEGEV